MSIFLYRLFSQKIKMENLEQTTTTEPETEVGSSGPVIEDNNSDDTERVIFF